MSLYPFYFFLIFFFFFFNDTATTEIYTLSLHDALPIFYGLMSYGVTRRTNEIGIRVALGAPRSRVFWMILRDGLLFASTGRSEEHTSELQSHHDLVCRLLLEKKNTNLHNAK